MADPQHAGGTGYLNWLGNASGPPGRSGDDTPGLPDRNRIKAKLQLWKQTFAHQISRLVSQALVFQISTSVPDSVPSRSVPHHRNKVLNETS